jgi:predicted aconitase with swiveling domain
MELTGRVLVEGAAKGVALVLDEPLSFWGGVDPHTGEIIDRHHPQSGVSTTGKILVMPHGRGSSSASYVLAECIRAGTGPAGIVLRSADSIITLGALVAAELYPDRSCPVVVVAGAYGQICDGADVVIRGPAVVSN